MKSMVIFTALSATLALAAGPNPPAGSLAAQGQGVYKANCVLCHGENGDGNGPAGSMMSPKPRDFTVGKFKKGGSPAQLANTVTHGLDGTAMPAFGTQLSADDVKAVVSYIQLFKKK